MANLIYNPNLTIPIGGSVAPPQTGPQTIIVSYPKRSSRREGYKSKPSQICGILLIMSGVGAIITQSVGFAIQMKIMNLDYPYYSLTGEGYFGWSGVWTSPLVFLAASFAITSSKTKRVGFIVTTLVMSILSAVFVVLVIGLSSWVISEAHTDLKAMNFRFYKEHPDASYMIKRQEAVTGNNSQVIFMNNTPVPISSQPLHITNPETQVLMSPPMYAPGESVFQASGGDDLPPPYTDA